MIDNHHALDDLRRRIRHVPDFPKPGILFYDITTLLQDGKGFGLALDLMTAPHQQHRIDVVVGIESRGFIFGAAVADRLKSGFVPVRKPGKLPSKTRQASYALEYGADRLEMHEDAVTGGQRVLVVDDLLATGGTASATVGLIRALGGHVVGVQFLIELLALKGRQRLGGEQVNAVLAY
jgi:adenine phosphoribosyltransferase